MTDTKQHLWGGGSSEMHPALAAISDSLGQDAPLADADLRGCIAYAKALGKCGVLTDEESTTLADALVKLREEFTDGRWIPSGGEDVHTAIEQEITDRLGDLGGRLHTGRSRNDQVATAFRLAVMEEIDGLIQAIRSVQQGLVNQAQNELDTFVPSYTHLQRAQPIRLAHWLMAYFWPLERDIERLLQIRTRVSTLPLGSGAVSGHPFGIDRDFLASELGFERVSENSLDSVGDRDFAIDFAFGASMVALHLSRLSEELIIWSSSEFGYIQWRDDLATGSSLMPNKKNPDLAELVRGRSAQAVGDLVSLLVLIKGLPSSYQRDLQEDKPPVWRIAGATKASVNAMAAALEGIRFKGEKMGSALTDDTLATEMADVLVTRGLPFRQAYRIVSRLAKEARERDCGLKEAATQLPAESIEPLTIDDIQNLTIEGAIERRTTPGGTAKSAIELQLAKAQALLA